MIYGIGTDIVRVSRMQKNIEQYGDKFSRRILSDAELEDYASAVRPAHFLAKRFAAKEATAKAMGIGFSRGMNLRDIGVGHDDNGKPTLEYFSRAEELVNELGIGAGYISIADEDDHAVAFVTLLQVTS